MVIIIFVSIAETEEGAVVTGIEMTEDHQEAAAEDKAAAVQVTVVIARTAVTTVTLAKTPAAAETGDPAEAVPEVRDLMALRVSHAMIAGISKENRSSKTHLPVRKSEYIKSYSQSTSSLYLKRH